MRIKRCGLLLLGLLALLNAPQRRDQRGLSQSAENAILLAGAVAVATVVISVITIYVRTHLPR